MSIMSDNELKIEKEKREERMKNLINQMVNKNVKEKFLKTIDEEKGTRETYAVYLVQASSWEKNIKKDLYSFSREDVLDSFSDNFTSKHTALRILYSVCKQYVSWAIEEGYVKTMINPFELVKFKQHILPMLNIRDLENQYLSEEEIWEIADGKLTTDDYINAQDIAPILLVYFGGIKGEGCSELVNLKKQDLDYENNKITVMNNKGIIRDVKLPERVMEFIKDASEEKEYIVCRNTRSGELKEIPNKLYDNDYVFRPRVTSRKDINITEEPTAVLIFSRVKKTMKKAGYEKISINDIFNSGKLNALNNIYKEKGKIEIDDYKNVQEKFGDDPKNYDNLKILWSIYISKVE